MHGLFLRRVRHVFHGQWLLIVHAIELNQGLSGQQDAVFQALYRAAAAAKSVTNVTRTPAFCIFHGDFSCIGLTCSQGAAPA